MIFIQDNITEISDLLAKGKIILYPTDTIWGIGCDATNELAITRVFKMKKRDLSKPMIILVDSIRMLKEYVYELHPRIETLLSLHDRPLTVVYPRAKNLPDVLTAGKNSIGIRLAKDSFCRELIAEFGKPIVSSSANLADEPFPRHFGEISSVILKDVDYVVKYRQEEKNRGEPSVVATYDKMGQLQFIRT